MGFLTSSSCTSWSASKDASQCLGVFFFQAEDGIRDLTVTGVQTCALPIFDVATAIAVVTDRSRYVECGGFVSSLLGCIVQVRSEERRVGKEGRFRWPA